jgi:hypothetical protein
MNASSMSLSITREAVLPVFFSEDMVSLDRVK